MDFSLHAGSGCALVAVVEIYRLSRPTDATLAEVGRRAGVGVIETFRPVRGRGINALALTCFAGDLIQSAGVFVVALHVWDVRSCIFGVRIAHVSGRDDVGKCIKLDLPARKTKDREDE
jgi:hypothetical protein